MEELLSRIFEDLFGRLQGPMHFRFIMQPLMAILFAIRDGMKDAREGGAPYFWSLLTERGRRAELMRGCWKSVGKIFIIAFILDAVYQIWMLRMFYPGEALLASFMLAIVPYVLLRGPANRLMAWYVHARESVNGGSATVRKLR